MNAFKSSTLNLRHSRVVERIVQQNVLHRVNVRVVLAGKERIPAIGTHHVLLDDALNRAPELGLRLRGHRVQPPPGDFLVLLTADLRQRGPVLERRAGAVAVQQERPHRFAQALLEAAEEDALAQLQVVLDLALLVEQRAVKVVGGDLVDLVLLRVEFGLAHLRTAHHKLAVRLVRFVLA